MTLGKKIGLWAFIISELLLLLLLAIYFYCKIKKIETDITASAILTFQGTIFTTCWISKASSNFAPERKENKE